MKVDPKFASTQKRHISKKKLDVQECEKHIIMLEDLINYCHPDYFTDYYYTIEQLWKNRNRIPSNTSIKKRLEGLDRNTQNIYEKKLKQIVVCLFKNGLASNMISDLCLKLISHNTVRQWVEEEHPSKKYKHVIVNFLSKPNSIDDLMDTKLCFRDKTTNDYLSLDSLRKIQIRHTIVKLS
jgi:hypothetical protein